MITKYMTAGVMGAALLATAAFAQAPTAQAPTAQAPAAQAPAAQTPAATTDRANMAPAMASDSSYQGTWRASKLVGLNVYNDNNESLGSINDLLTDKSGNIKAVVVGVGGFLGVGEHLVAVPLDKIKFVNEPVVYAGAAAPKTATNTAPSSTLPPSSTTPSTTTGAANTAPAVVSRPNPWYPDHAVFSATKDQLKAMPQFKYST